MDTNLAHFYILGLPRSRTLWFSEFLSFADVKCVHEHFSIHADRELLEGVRGYSDTNPLKARDYGDSPVLIIERDIADVVDSVYNAFDKPKGIKDFKKSISNYINVYKKALDKITPKNCLRVPFNDINSQLLEIWHHLMPDIRPTYNHVIDYKDKIIKTDNRDLQNSLAHTFGSIEEFAKTYDRDLLETFRITDYAVVQHVMNSMWDEIAEDNAPPYTPDLLTEYWIGLKDGSKFVGCYRFHQIYHATWQGHVFMLPEHRKKYTHKGGFTILYWLLENIDFKKIVVDVPAKYKNVLVFLEGFGFKHEGVNRLSFTKDEKLWDVFHLGMTREEIEGLI